MPRVDYLNDPDAPPANSVVPAVSAIVPDSDDRATAWVETNRTYAAQWPNITRKGEAPADADEWKDKPDKAKLFSAEPGEP